VKAQGARDAQLERSVVVERGADPQTSAKDIEAAITLLIMTEQLGEKDGLIHFAGFGPARALPSSQLNKTRVPTIRSDARAHAYPRRLAGVSYDVVVPFQHPSLPSDEIVHQHHTS